jgi:hypothetical protein
MNFTDLSSDYAAADLAGKFFNNIASPCNKWYHDASKSFLAGQDAFLP